MKKRITLLLCSVMVLFLSGCGLKNLKNVELPPLPRVTEAIVTPKPTFVPPSTPEPSPEPTPEPTPVPTPEPTPEEPLGPDGQVIVNYKHTTQKVLDPEEGKQRILLFSYDSPYVSIEGHPEAADAINEQIAYIDESFYTGGTEGDGYGFHGMQELAEDNYAYVRQSGDTERGVEFYSTRTVRTARVDNSVISFVFSYEDYTGGVKNYSHVGCVFNAETGEVLRLEDLSGDYETLSKRLVHELVSLTASDHSLYQHVYQEYMNNDYHGTLGKLLRPGAWYFDKDGLVFESSLYELGPYVAGLAVFRIPYSKFADVIDPKWLPNSRDGSGSIRAAAMEDGQDGAVRYLDRVVADRRGQELCLVVEGTVYDVKLSRAAYEGGFYETEELWFCSVMQDSTVQLVTEFPEGMPDLMVRCTDAQGNETRMLVTADLTDGNYQLVDEKEVVPVG